jgi:hypothetical protein
MEMSKHIINRLENIGFVRALLDGILGNSIFDNLSKHNSYWDSADSIAGEKLYDVRIGLRDVEDGLLKISEVLKQDAYDDED